MGSLMYFLICFFNLLGGWIICLYTTSPVALIPMIVALFLSNKVRNYYLKTQREVCRF